MNCVCDLVFGCVGEDVRSYEVLVCEGGGVVVWVVFGVYGS